MIPSVIRWFNDRAATRAADQDTLDVCARAAIAERRHSWDRGSVFDQTVYATGVTPGVASHREGFLHSDEEWDALLAEMDLLALPITLDILHDHAGWAA